MSHDSLLEPVIAAALAGGREILAVVREGFVAREKADRSPVTIADERAEAVILAALRQTAPEMMIIAEEAAASGGLPESVDGPFWLVDPLDGTKEFLKGGDDYTVNIALIEQGEPVLGVVFCPANGRLFAGVAGKGAFEARVDDKGDIIDKRPIRTRKNGRPLRIVASKSHSNAETEAYLGNYPDAELVSVGSSLKFCLVATGEADLYPRLGPTMEWDTAAGHGVLRAAGGVVTDAAGDPFRYYKPGFRNGFFIARGDADFQPARIVS